MTRIVTGAGALLAVASLIGAMNLNAGETSMSSQANDDERLAEVREFVRRGRRRSRTRAARCGAQG